jgi:hypothetical protein
MHRKEDIAVADRLHMNPPTPQAQLQFVSCNLSFVISFKPEA